MHEPHNLYHWGLCGYRTAPQAERLRFEDAARPDFGELVTVGSIVRTSYGTGPYRVSQVNRYEPFPGVFYWSVVCHDIVDGVAVKGSGDKYLNEYVVQWEGDKPRLLGLFKNSGDEIYLDDGVAYVATRKGQLSLF